MNEKPNVNIVVENKKITLIFEEDTPIKDIWEVCSKIFDRFYGERCKIVIGSCLVTNYILEALKMLHIDAKLNEDTDDIEFWTNKNDALLYLDEAITLDDEHGIPIINRIMRWCAICISEMFKDKYPKEYSFIGDNWLRMALLDHMVANIFISNEKGDVRFERYMTESLAESTRTYKYFIESKEKQDKFLKFLEEILKQNNIKAKIKKIENEQQNV